MYSKVHRSEVCRLRVGVLTRVLGSFSRCPPMMAVGDSPPGLDSLASPHSSCHLKPLMLFYLPWTW
jgi:hypothetical protein